MNAALSRILLVTVALWAVSWMAVPVVSAAAFPGNARVEITDSSGGLSWNNTTNALTVACWFKLSIPSDFSLTEDMAILVNRRSGTATDTHAYAIYLSAATGNIEFTSRGSASEAPRKLIDHPYLERWYHVAVVRNGSSLQGFVDGREVFNVTTTVGDSRTTDGVSIGGWGNGKYLRGEVQEVAIYPAAVGQEFITQYLFTDLPIGSFGPLEPSGYYKLASSSTASDQLKNFALTPPAGTNPATTQGAGAVAFDATDKAGEQSRFDSQKNEGRDATTPLSGGFSWNHSVLSRATPGVPFEFEIGYASGNAFNSNNLGSFNPFADSVLGSGWRHAFDTRVIPSNYFSPIGGTDVVGLMLWDGSLEVWEDLAFTGTYSTRHREYRGELRFPNPSTCEWVTPDRLIYKFQSPFSGSLLMRGRLLQVRDFNGNALNLTWNTVLGRITRVADTFGGIWDFTYLPSGRLDKVVGLGWTSTFTYDGQNRLASKTITGPASYAPVSSTQWQFFYNAQGLLERIVDPKGFNDTRIIYDTYGRKFTEQDAIGRTTQFEYNKPALRQVTTTELHGSNTALNRSVVDSFDRKLRLLSRLDPMGFTSSYEYDDITGDVLATIDARGVRSTMSYDTRSNMTSRINGLSEKTEWKYAQTDDPVGSTNGHLPGGILLNKPLIETRPSTAEAPAGWENRYEYDAAGNLRFHRDGPWPEGEQFRTLAEHRYQPNGLVESSFDARGNESRFTYNATTGFLTSRTIAFGTPDAATWNVTARTELGWPVTEINPLSEPTTLGYNINGQVVSTTDAIGRIFIKDYDANGNLTTESDGKGVNTGYGYNQADERITRTDRAGNVWDFRYNEFGELRETEGPAAFSDGATQRDIFSRTYDKNGRLREERDPYYDAGAPALHRIAYEYDESGNQTAVVNKLGQRWEKSYDALNRVFAERDPLGSVRRTAYDAAGRVLVVTAPEGHQSRHEYDGRGRLARWMDPEGFAWEYLYDGVGNIEKIIDAEHGEYVMTYGPRNERLTERNQDLKTWTYTYDKLVRLKTQANPPGAGAGPGGGPVLRTLYYDPVGRLDYVEFNTGRINDLGYDDNNNVRSIVRTQPGKPPTSLALDYDGLDRLAEVRDTFSKTVRYEYDALGRVNKKRYPGGKDLIQEYDRLGRLKKLSFPNVAGGTHDCTFAYDDADRLTGRTYPNGITQTNTFDTAGRVETLGYAGTASPPIALGYAYDRNGNKTGGTENGTLAWKKSSLADYNDTSRFKADGKLIDRTDAAAAGGPRTFGYTYDASGNMTLATAPGESYALTYDEDNRTTSITWDVGLTEKQIVNRYDGLGRRVSRTLDGAETRYVLDLMGAMERILCDTDATGTIQAWYIHGHDLCFRVSAAGALTCYHADGTGNIVRTTTTSGVTRNQYSYTPFGRSIPVPGSTPDIDDPYRFAGSQGVMQELPNLYFMRARYYSADAAVLLATDPLKNIGSGWKPQAFLYGNDNPLAYLDATGNVAVCSFIGVPLDWQYDFWLLEGWGGGAPVGACRLHDAMIDGRNSEGRVYDGNERLVFADNEAGAGFRTQAAENVRDLRSGPLGDLKVKAALGHDLLVLGRAVTEMVAYQSVTAAQKTIAWAASDPTPTNGGTYANSTTALPPSLKNSKPLGGGAPQLTLGTGGGGGGSASGGSMTKPASNGAVNAGNYGISLNIGNPKTGGVTTPAIIKKAPAPPPPKTSKPSLVSKVTGFFKRLFGKK